MDNYVAVDTETTGLRWTEDHAFGVAFAWDTENTFIRNSKFGEAAIGKLISELYTSDKTVVMHNAEFDLHMIRETYGVQEFPNKIIDTLRVAHILDTAADHTLKGWGDNVYGDIASYWEGLVSEYRKKYKVKSYDLLPTDILDPYAAHDAHLTKCLAYKFVPTVMKSSPMIFKLEHELIPAILDMEKEGLKVDLDYIVQQQQRLKQEQFAIEQKIFGVVGKHMNPASPKMVGEYLYEQQNVPVQYTDEGNVSTDNRALSEIDHPVAQLVLDWRTAAKEENTYYSPYIKFERNGRVHPHWNMVGTKSGRMSSSSPNAQNVPKKSEARRMFIPDGMFIDIDYSQIELRMLAHATKEPILVEAFKENADLHRLTASNIFGIGLDDVSDDQRSIGKTLNFAIIYGAGSKRIADTTGVSLDEGELFRSRYWETYPGVESYNYRLKRQADDTGQVQSIFGRKITVPDSRAALNYVIQGSAADLMKIALVRCWKYAKENGGSIRNVIHDEILFDNLDESHVPKLQEVMENFNLEVATPSDAQISHKSWRDLEDV